MTDKLLLGLVFPGVDSSDNKVYVKTYKAAKRWQVDTHNTNLLSIFGRKAPIFRERNIHLSVT